MRAAALLETLNSAWRLAGRESSVADDDVGRTLLWQDKHGLKLYRVGEVGHFRLQFGPSISFDVLTGSKRISNRSAADLPEATLRHFLADQVIPRVIAHDGKLVMHGAAASLDGRAFVAMGDTGAGKSTLAASFAETPETLLGDDALVLSWLHDRPLVRALYPSLRLLPDSLNAIVSDQTGTSSLAHYTPKRRVDVPVGFHDHSDVPISALFVLDTSAKPASTSIVPLSAAEACVTIVRNSFSLDPTDIDRSRQRLQEASRLANAVPAFRLSYPRDYARLPEVRDAVIEHLRNRL